ncbi:MAG: acyl-CoA dehydrogenase family protein, partial [Thermoanaerobaculia bacterium]|nr:acyl-CoA dehydrogenase family protein [Thermoanaerobaculia bacterium]
LQPLVREHADATEAARRLAEPVVAAMADAGLYRIAAPADVGGGETEPETQIRVIEAVSEADGATGWTLMIGIENTGFLGGAIGLETGREIFADPRLVVAGALNPLGRAVAEAGGFRASGRWPFVSGCESAQWFWGQCIVWEGDERARESDGRVRLIEIVVPRGDFRIHDTWHTSGMRGSGSHDVEVDDLFVPERLVTTVSNHGLRSEGTLYRMPLYSRLAYNKVGVATGIARAAIDRFVELASDKTPRASKSRLRQRADAQRAVAEAEALLESARAYVFDTVGNVWRASQAGDEVTLADRARLQLACSHACSAAVRAVEKVHAAAGTSANFLSSPLERCFRDVHVVRQHIMVSGQWIDAVGRVMLGLESGSPLLI